MKKLALIALVAVIVSACAKEPDSIAAIPVAGDPYSRYSCSQLSQEELKLTQSLEVASAQQSTAASNDALGVFFLGLPLASMSGSDKEAFIAVTKGQLQEIDRVQLAKGCS